MAEESFDSSSELAVRRRKLQQLKEQGRDPFRLDRFDFTHETAEIHDRFDSLQGKPVSIAGRIMSKREHGKVSFAHVRDGSGEIQLYASINDLGEECYGQFKDLDVGDIIGVRGSVFKTRRGETTIKLDKYTLLAKALRPLPEKWHGLKDVDLRYRQRYVDLIANPQVREVFVTRSRIIQFMRDYLTAEGFLEVETPMLSPIAGGANARPFVTYHNALDMRLYLRIAPELYLKRLIVGGFQKVFEINRNFRNEGISTKHNPEYTSMECYQAFANADDVMRITEEIISGAAQKVTGSMEITYQGVKIDLTPPWPRVSMVAAVKKYSGLDFGQIQTASEARQVARAQGYDVDDQASWGQVLNDVFDAAVEPNLIQPVFIR
jgi:lysyl-tRNA synthetase class 2